MAAPKSKTPGTKKPVGAGRSTRPLEYGYDRTTIMDRMQADKERQEETMPVEITPSREEELEGEVALLRARLEAIEQGETNFTSAGRKLFLFQDIGLSKLNGPVKKVLDNQDSIDVAREQCMKSGHVPVIRELKDDESDTLVPWMGAAPTIVGKIPGVND